MPIVGAVLGAIGLVTSIAGAIGGGVGKRDAQYAAADLKQKQAELGYQQSEEQIRRETLQTKQAIGQTVATGGATGFWAGGGTMSKYVQAFATEMQGRLAYAQKIAEQQRSLGLQAADVTRQAADAGLWGDITGAVGGAFQGAGSIFSELKLGQTAPAPPVGGTP